MLIDYIQFGIRNLRDEILAFQLQDEQTNFQHNPVFSLNPTTKESKNPMHNKMQDLTSSSLLSKSQTKNNY
jgi:hypothetical protein